MHAHEIVVAGRYVAKVSQKLTIVRVTAVRQVNSWGGRSRTVYDVVNENTGRRTVFHSAAKFRMTRDAAVAQINAKRAAKREAARLAALEAGRWADDGGAMHPQAHEHTPAPRVVPALGSPLPTCAGCGEVYASV